jgi:Rad3-related DNA helicase
MTYQLPHPLDRPGQAEAMQWILESDKRYLILCAPTGFGKSPLAAQASVSFKTMALVLHKSLQSANYKDQYDFDILYGKSNYPCLEPRHSKQLRLAGIDLPQYTAFDCGNPHCDCPYQSQEKVCLSSYRSSLNYAKFLMSGPFIDTCNLQYLFLDEAHNLPEIITDFVGFTVTWDNEFIQCNGGLKPHNTPMRLNHNEAMTIFRQIGRAVESNRVKRDENLQKWRKWKRIKQRIDITNSVLAGGSLNDWYYEATDKGLIIKPLTAKYHFKRLFDKANKVVMMSATIKPTIAEKLGIESDEFDFHEVSNPWPTPTRLIYDLGGPAMNYKSSEADKQEQARLIASVLSRDLCGTIHVSSKAQARELTYRLSSFADYDYFLPPEGIGTDAQLQAWYDYRQAGAYCISWAFQEGVDLGQDDIGIMAKTPYPGLGSSYEKARLEYDKAWYLEKTAYIVEQICGRPRRGKSEHYRPGAKMVYIADSAYHKLKTLLSDDFRRSIRRYNRNE